MTILLNFLDHTVYQYGLTKFSERLYNSLLSLSDFQFSNDVRYLMCPPFQEVFCEDLIKKPIRENEESFTKTGVN